VLPDPTFISRRSQIVALAARRALPAIHFLQEFAEAGGLMSHSSVSDRLLALADEAIDHAAFADASCSTFINRSAGKGFVRYARHPDRTADSRAEGLSFPVT
jgi:hypothetical protein